MALSQVGDDIVLSATVADRESQEVVMRKLSAKATAGIVSGGLIVSLGLVAAPAAQALPAFERDKAGTCSAGAWWELSLDRESGILEVDFDVERARPGERWTFTIKHNGQTGKAVRTVADYEGDADAQWFFRDRPGRDKVAVLATSSSGQTCKATGRI